MKRLKIYRPSESICQVIMGAEEDSTPTKTCKATASTQEVPSTPAYPDWSSPMQAYYGAGVPVPPFFASTVASPAPHPYLWGGQHPMISPYGTPVPYPMYPPYAHPGMAMTPNATQTNADTEGKGTGGKDQGSVKKSKGNSGGKAGGSGKAASSSGNDIASQSGESGCEGTSDGSDENQNQQEFVGGKKRGFNQMLADANAQSLVPGKPVVPVPATTLNIGMDLWNGPGAATGAMKMRPNPSDAGSGPVIGREGVVPEHWDERELKRQKRKQSNRESARRSRLRKQAECEELQGKVENLTSDNNGLREELQRLSEQCEKLTSENNSMKEELTRLCGPEAVANLERSKSPAPESQNDEGELR